MMKWGATWGPRTLPSSPNKCYRFSFGNSTNGAIGGVIVVRAANQKVALERARSLLEAEMEFADHRFKGDIDERNEYFNIYFNAAALSLDHLQDVYSPDDTNEPR